MSKAAKKVKEEPAITRKRGRPKKDPMAPRVESALSIGCTYAEQAKINAEAMEVRGRSTSQYLREMIGLEPNPWTTIK